MVGGCGIDRGTGWNIGQQALDFEGFNISAPALFERLDRLPQFPPSLSRILSHFSSSQRACTQTIRGVPIGPQSPVLLLELSNPMLEVGVMGLVPVT